VSAPTTCSFSAMAPVFADSRHAEPVREAMSSWTRFLKNVKYSGHPPADDNVIQQVAEWFVDMGYANPGCAVGFNMVGFEKIPAKEFVKSALMLLDKRSQARALEERDLHMSMDHLRREMQNENEGAYKPILRPPSKKAPRPLAQQRPEPAPVETTKSPAPKEVAKPPPVQVAQAEVHEDVSKAKDHIIVQTHVDGSEFSIEIGLGDTVSQLKQRIAFIVKVPVQEVALAMGSTILGEDEALLEDCGIQCGSRLSFFLEEAEPVDPLTAAVSRRMALQSELDQINDEIAALRNEVTSPPRKEAAVEQ